MESQSTKNGVSLPQEDATLLAFRRRRKKLIVIFSTFLIFVALTIAALITFLILDSGLETFGRTAAVDPSLQAFCSFADSTSSCLASVEPILYTKQVTNPNQIFTLSLETAAEELEILISNSTDQSSPGGCSSTSLREALNRINGTMSLEDGLHRYELMNRIEAAEEDLKVCTAAADQSEKVKSTAAGGLERARMFLGYSREFLSGYDDVWVASGAPWYLVEENVFAIVILGSQGELRGANPSTRGLGWANLWSTGCYANSSAGQLSWYGRTAAQREILLYTSSRTRVSRNVAANPSQKAEMKKSFRIISQTSTSESEEVENPRLEKKALSPVGSGQAKGPTLSIRAPFARRVRRHGLFPGYLPRLGKRFTQAYLKEVRLMNNQLAKCPQSELARLSLQVRTSTGVLYEISCYLSPIIMNSSIVMNCRAGNYIEENISQGQRELALAQAEDGVPKARGHILGGNSSINAGFYSGADQQFYQKSGVNWNLRVVNEPYEWVEKAIVFRPEFSNWQSLVRADVPFLGSRAPSDPFRRAESKYSVEQVGVTVEFYGGELNGVSYSDPATVKKDAIHVVSMPVTGCGWRRNEATSLIYDRAGQVGSIPSISRLNSSIPRLRGFLPFILAYRISFVIPGWIQAAADRGISLGKENVPGFGLFNPASLRGPSLIRKEIISIYGLLYDLKAYLFPDLGTRSTLLIGIL
ncbi:hypothetical protein F511_18675 [Dorcoceras hygrometricum]|uniref:Uncharacterized protein n=1 Tax=Dorcoceras hygrometricum TaxID=472368 RepID=A0A2Z7BZ67_9LAMI|nr:hypothetical protein F511_18675 [Dorcoceras hygrometricum]